MTNEAALRPVGKEPLTTRAADILREYLLSGAVRPGARLTEIALAEQLQTARTTVRMILNQLAFEGIVTKIPYTGWQVADLTAESVWELWTLRGSLEGLAARLVADDLDESRRRAVEAADRALCVACAEGEIGEINAADFSLHRTIVELSQHTRLIKQYSLVEHQVRFYIAASNMFVAADGEDIVSQHRPLISALLANDGDRASHEAWLHNEREGRRLSHWLETRTEEFTPSH